MKARILTLLREGNDYISGQELCNNFGVSRTAVWKAVNQLKEEGYVIEAVKNKGYKLLNQPDILSEKEISGRLATEYMGRTLFCFQKTGSTNTEAKRLLEEGGENGLLVIAGTQTSGKGRKGRGWDSPEGTSIYMTIGLKPEFEPQKASMLTLLMAMAVVKGIKKSTGITTAIKWPNDIVLNNKKICGILTELTMERDYISSVVIGAGINANNEEFPESIQAMATSLFLENGKKVLRAQITADIVKEFEDYYEQFSNELSLAFLVDEYNSYLVNKNAKVRVLDPKNQFEGIAKGINERGELLVEREDGQVIEVYAGEVSVRGIYGYV